jgi:hypothetical protein
LLQKKLGSDYVVINNNKAGIHKIQVFRKIKNDISQEVFIELQKTDDSSVYNLILNQRGKEFNEAQFNDIDESICALGIYAESVLGDRIRDSVTRSEILELANKSISILASLLDSKVGSEYFSIFKEKKKAINLEEINNGIFNIYYLSPSLDKVFLIKDRESPSAFVVLYNYAQRLKQFTLLYNEWKKDVVLDSTTEEKIRRLYLGK